MHQDSPWNENLYKLSHVGALLWKIHHKNNLALGAAFNFQKVCHHLSITGGLWSQKVMEWPSFGELEPCCAWAQMSSYSPSVIRTWDSEKTFVKESQSSRRLSRMPSWLGDFQAWDKIVELSRSTMWVRREIPLLKRKCMRFGGIIYPFPHLNQGSIPMQTRLLDPILHANASQM